jgi:UDP-glucose 4-epimerase
VTWLVTGGAGYIGAHVVRALLAHGLACVVVDNMSTGLARRVPPEVPVHVLDVGDTERVADVLTEHSVVGVVHLAAKKSPTESVSDPLRYYRENVGGVVSLLTAMARCDVRRIVFSSSSSVYGTPTGTTVDESAPLVPINPYGATKAICERIVGESAAAYGIDAILLRYFNVAGAGEPSMGDVGTFNLVPLALRAAAAGDSPLIFGDDYPTPDGTCVRDYVHVADLAEAHVAAARDLESGRREPAARAYNIGTGVGHSVHEVLAVVRDVTATTMEPVIRPRRPGDPAAVVGEVGLVARELGWHSRLDLRDMVQSAWDAWAATHDRPSPR